MIPALQASDNRQEKGKRQNQYITTHTSKGGQYRKYIEPPEYEIKRQGNDDTNSAKENTRHLGLFCGAHDKYLINKFRSSYQHLSLIHI